MKFVTKDDVYDITGKLVVGETYTFKETSAPSGYRLAKPVKVTIKDTGDVQKVTVKDESIPDVPETPQTGGQSVKGIVFGGLFIILLVIINIVEKVSVTKK